jgi:hypothetical protein
MNSNRIDGVIIVIALVFCGLLFWQNPPTETRQASKPVRDPVTGIEVSGRAVIMISKQGCAPCEMLKRETLPEAREAGYETTIVEQAAESYPTTRIFDGRRWQTRVGFFRWGR